MIIACAFMVSSKHPFVSCFHANEQTWHLKASSQESHNGNVNVCDVNVCEAIHHAQYFMAADESALPGRSSVLKLLKWRFAFVLEAPSV